MRSWKSHRLTSYTRLGLNPQIGRPLSRIVVPLVYFFFLRGVVVSLDDITAVAYEDDIKKIVQDDEEFVIGCFRR
jgi:hypothetical protein